MNIDFIRSQFPGLKQGWAFFDNAGGTQIVQHSLDRITSYLEQSNVQLGGSYAVSQRAATALADARVALQVMCNAERPEEIVFASSSTVALQNLALALRSQLKPGDEVIVTVVDHESNIGPWTRLAEYGVKLKTWMPCPETLSLRLEDLESLMTSRTRLVAVTHSSNILGTVNPIREIAAKVHEQGARICVDSVAFAPHRALDVQALDVDYLVFSMYKVFGPHTAVMYGRYEQLLALDNLYHYFYADDAVPHKLEPGNANYELACGAAGVVDYLDEVGADTVPDGSRRERIVAAYNAFDQHETQLGELLLAYLRARSDVQIVGLADGNDPARVPTISFKVRGQDSGAIARSIDEYQIAVRFGDFHARRLIEYLKLNEQGGVVRVSMAHYNTVEEVTALLQALDAVLP